MLKNLYIKNYAIIDELNIEFGEGFNVFTGETGAGKSIIAGALSYLIRGKADPGVIRSGQDRALIEGVFTIEDYMKEPLKEALIDFEDELIVRRIITRDNHNSIRINDSTVTLNFLSELFSDHIDIHSQKDSQYLFNRRNHLLLLDKFAMTKDLLKEYAGLYDIYRQKAAEYDELANRTYNESELDFYRFDYDELDKAGLSEEEENELLNKEKRYKSAEKYLTALKNALSLFEDEDGVDEKLSQLIKELNIDDNEIIQIKDSLLNSYYDLSDSIARLKELYSRFSEEDVDIDKIEERLYAYSRLKRKHNLDTAALLAKKKELAEKIRFFEDKDFVLSEKKKEMDQAYNDAYEIARRIHELRVNKAAELEERIIRETEDLMLNNVVFRIDIREGDLKSDGFDEVEFLISLNRGEELKPLKNVASGGEISRLMLALKTVFSSFSDISLLIFDEIDTGVSGKVASAIGRKIARIARDKQVLAISHLAAVAACADTHYYIYKNDDGGFTKTLIRKLNEEEIIRELALISSSDSSASALEAAAELYHSSQEMVRNES